MAESLSKIRDFRNRIGMTTTELGAAVGLTSASISRIEAGKQNITVDNLNKIALALGVRLVDLLDDAGQKVAYALVQGTMGGKMFELGRAYTIPVPLPLGREYAAFETEAGFYVGTWQRPEFDAYGQLFVLNLAPTSLLYLSTFQGSVSGPGFQVDALDPAQRWIRIGDVRISLRCRVVAEIKYLGLKPQLSAPGHPRDGRSMFAY